VGGKIKLCWGKRARRKEQQIFPKKQGNSSWTRKVRGAPSVENPNQKIEKSGRNMVTHKICKKFPTGSKGEREHPERRGSEFWKVTNALVSNVVRAQGKATGPKEGRALNPVRQHCRSFMNQLPKG